MKIGFGIGVMNVRTYSLSELDRRIRKAQGIQLLIRSRREQRASDNKPRTEEEKLLLMEISNRKWQRNMVRIGERTWRYIGE